LPHSLNFTKNDKQHDATMKPKLIRVDPGTPKTRIVLKKLPAVLGRSPDVSICLDDRWASRLHCEISEINGTLVVRDLESRNGTLVNGELVTEALLMPGDRLTVGLTSFRVHYKRGKTNASKAPSAVGHVAHGNPDSCGRCRIRLS